MSYSHETCYSYSLHKEDPKYINKVTHPLSSADIIIFHWKSANFAISRNANINCILMHKFLFKDCSNKYGYNFDDVNKKWLLLAFLKQKYF